MSSAVFVDDYVSVHVSLTQRKKTSWDGDSPATWPSPQFSPPVFDTIVYSSETVSWDRISTVTISVQLSLGHTLAGGVLIDI
jgi:hypothetical protein